MKLLTSLLLLLTMQQLSAQWSQVYYKPYSDIRGNSICRVGNSGYLIGGIVDQHNILALKVTPEGNVEWSKTYYYPASHFIRSRFIATSDKGFAAVGDLSNHFLLLKTDQYGDTLWAGTVGFDETLVTGDVFEGEDHSIIAIMYSSNDGSGIVKVDSTGEMVWTYYFPETTLTTGKAMGDSGYILAGEGVAPHSLVLIRMQTDGTIEWSKSCFINGTPLNISLKEDGFLLSSYDIMFNYLSEITFDGILTKITQVSVQTGERPVMHFREPDPGYYYVGPGSLGTFMALDGQHTFSWGENYQMDVSDAAEGPAGSYVILGNGSGDASEWTGITNTSSVHPSECAVNPLVSQSSIYPENIPLVSVIVQQVISVNYQPYHPEVSSFPLLQADDCPGFFTGIKDHNLPGQKITITPNPVTSTAVITLPEGYPAKDLRAEVYDMSGRKVNPVINFPGMNCSNLAPGLYHLILYSEDGGRAWSAGFEKITNY